MLKSKIKLEQYLDKDDLSKVDRICQWFSIDRDFILDMAIYTFEDRGRFTSGVVTVPRYSKKTMYKKLFNKEFTRYALQWYIDGFEQFFIDYANGGILPQSVEGIRIDGTLLNGVADEVKGFDGGFYGYDFINYNGRLCRVPYESLYNLKYLNRDKIEGLYQDILICSNKLDKYNIKDELVKRLKKYRRCKNREYRWKSGLYSDIVMDAIDIDEYRVIGCEIYRLGIFYVFEVVERGKSVEWDDVALGILYKKMIKDSLTVDVSVDIQKFIVESLKSWSCMDWMYIKFSGHEYMSILCEEVKKEVKELIKENIVENAEIYNSI